MTNLLMLLQLCFECIAGNINFALYYTLYKCIYKIYNSIYILIILSVQLISDHEKKHFDYLRGYKLNFLLKFVC